MTASENLIRDTVFVCFYCNFTIFYCFFANFWSTIMKSVGIVRNYIITGQASECLNGIFE